MNLLINSIVDYSISVALEVWYSATEPEKLVRARKNNEDRYLYSEETPLISVYTPTYNRGSILIERAVSSVLEQSYKNFEYIVIGDGCTDNTAELIHGIADPRIRFVNIERSNKRYRTQGDDLINHWLAGPVVPANIALSMVRGKWIARLDDHAVWTSDHLLSLLRFAQRGNFEFVTAVVREERYGEISLATGHHAIGPYFRNLTKPKKAVGNPLIGSTQTFFYRQYLKCFRYNIHCWRKKFNRVNDIDLTMRMYKSGVRMGFLNQTVADIKPRPGEHTIAIDAFGQRVGMNVR